MNTRLPSVARAGVLACAAFACSPTLAVIVEGNIETSIRPFVWTQYPDRPGSLPERTAAAIFDTGDPWETLSRETASVLGIAPATPVNPDPVAATRFQNQGTAAAQDVTSGGWLGGVFQPPERNSVATAADAQIRGGDNAHLYTGVGLARVLPSSSSDLRLWYGDYQGDFSENHTGMPFVTRSNPAENLAVLVDPINGTPLPFPYDEDNAGNGRGLGGPSLPLDMLASSITYFANDDRRVPEPGRNDNPGFVHFIDLAPVEFATSLLPAPAWSSVAALPAGVESRLTLTVSNADGPNVARVVPDAGLAPEIFYRPADAAGTTAFALTNITHNVSAAAQLRGGTTNAAGFVRSDGELQVVVRQTDGTVVLNQTVPQPSQAPRPFISVGGVNYLVDTGAPTTRVPPAVFATGNATADPDVNILPTLNIPTTDGGMLTFTNVAVTNAGARTPIIGTDITNRFGQAWDFSPGGRAGAANNGTLTLIGPTDPRIRHLRGEGIVFNVDTGTLGLAATAVQQEHLFGSIPQLQGNPTGVPAIGAATLVTPVAPPEQQSTVFRTHLTGSNASYIDEAALGLERGGTVINAQSLGADDIDEIAQLFFSVDHPSVGQPGSAVAVQAALRQQASDIFEVPLGQPTPVRVPLSNQLTINQEVIGLGDNVGPAAVALPSPDNLLDFDLLTQLALPARSMSNLDSPVVGAGDAGTAARPRVGTERLAVNFDSYFSLLDDQNLYRSNIGDLFADGFVDIGLSALGQDDIDALALYRPSVAPGVRGGPMVVPGPFLSANLQINPANGGLTFDANVAAQFLGIDMFQGLGPSDLALFSLSPDSLTLAALGLSPADIFVTDFDGTFTLFASAESLGLRFADNIDGLDSLAIGTVPETNTLPLLLSGLVVLVLLRRARRRGAACALD